MSAIPDAEPSIRDVESLLNECARYALEGPYGHVLSTPRFAIEPRDIREMAEGIRLGLIDMKPRGRFNALDRPTAAGRWALLSFYRTQTIINGEYLPQIAGYVDLIRRLGYPPERVLFEPGDRYARVDHVVLSTDDSVFIMGEAKVDPTQPIDIVRRIRDRYSSSRPAPGSRPPKSREYEAWKTADAIWALRPTHLWLVAPGVRLSFAVTYDPLTLREIDDLPLSEPSPGK